MIQFVAEITEVKAKVTASNDKEYTVRLRTNDSKALLLQEFIAEEVVSIEVKKDGEV